MIAAGVDLAGVETRPTGFCLLDAGLRARTSILHTDDEIMAAVARGRPGVVAIDAPLALPRGRELLAVRSDVHLRECDRALLRMGIKFIPLTLGPMRQLTARGIILKGRLEVAGMTVIETYPGAAQDILHIPRKGKGLARLWEGLETLGIKGLRPPMTADELDAVTCAFVGLLYLKRAHQAIGDPDEMLMILPKPPS